MTSPNQTTSAIQTITESNLVRTPVRAQSGPGLSLRRSRCTRSKQFSINLFPDSGITSGCAGIASRGGGQPAVPSQRPQGGHHGLAELAVPVRAMPARRGCRGRRAGSTRVRSAHACYRRSVPYEGHAAGAGHRTGRPPPRDRAALRQARHPARAPQAREAVAPGHRAARPPARARAPPEGDQRGRRPARALAEDSRGGQGLQERGQGRRRRRAQAPRRGGRPRLRGGAAPARAERRPGQARPVRLARARPLGRAPLRALPLLSRVGRRAASTASTSPATATTSSSGRASPSSPASARSRRARCSSSTSPSPTRAPSASSAS